MQNQRGAHHLACWSVIKNHTIFRTLFTNMCSSFAVPPKLAPFAISDEPLHLGDYFQLTCAVLHGDFPYNITWYFNDEPITYIDGVSILMHGKRSSSLNIDSVSAAHSGNYSCIGSNVAGRASITTTLSIRGLCALQLSHTRFEHHHQILFSFLLVIH